VERAINKLQMMIRAGATVSSWPSEFESFRLLSFSPVRLFAFLPAQQVAGERVLPAAAKRKLREASTRACQKQAERHRVLDTVCSE